MVKKKFVILGTQPEWLLNVRGPLISDLLRRGYAVTCVAAEPNAYIESALAKMGADYHAISIKRNEISLLGDIYYMFNIYKFCRRTKPSCVLAYTIKPVVFGAVAARVAGVKDVFALITGLGYVFTGQTLRQRALRVIVRALYALAFFCSKKVFFQNKDDRDEFSGLMRAQKAVVVAGSGVDLKQFVSYPVQKTPITFLLIARLIADKGIREYAAAASTLGTVYPDTRFVIVGPTDPNPTAITQAEIQAWNAPGSKIEYAGPQKDVRSFLERCSVFVLPSYYREGTPRTVLEAMACGRPIITTDAPGCRETVVHHKTGLLIPVKDVDALIDAMRRFIDNPALIDSMGRAARTYAESKYDVRNVNYQMISEMESVSLPRNSIADTR